LEGCRNLDYIITEKNFISTVKSFCKGANRADGYNNDCFSTSEVLRSRDINEMIGYLIETLEEKGYSASNIMNPIMKPYKRWVNGDSPSGLKEHIDGEIQINFQEFKQAWDYCHAVA